MRGWINVYMSFGIGLEADICDRNNAVKQVENIELT